MNSLEKRFPQEFWFENFGENRIITYCEFLASFEYFLNRYGSHKLDERQEDFLNKIIDPSKTGLLTFLEFNIFFQHFWLVPHQRELFFELQKNEGKIFKNANKNSILLYFIKAPENSNYEGAIFEFTETQITNNAKGLKKGDGINFLKQKKCLTIGSSETLTDILISDDPYVQPKAIKIVLSERKLFVRDLSSVKQSRAMMNLVDEHLLLDCHEVIRFGNDFEFTILTICPSLKSEKRMKFEVSDIKKPKSQNHEIHINELILRQRDKTIENDTNEFLELQRKNSEITSIKQYRDILERNEYENQKYDELYSKTLYLKVSNSSQLAINSELIDCLELIGDKLVVSADSKLDFTIGRDATCDIILKSLGVSKFHSKLWYEKEVGWKLKNIDKSNAFGTKVYLGNSEQLSRGIHSNPHQLQNGVILSFGDYSIQIECE